MLGEMAHICGNKPGANRYDSNQTAIERSDYRNLILLCPTHHRLIDRKEKEAFYTVEKLRGMKDAHETRVAERLDNAPISTKADVALKVVPLLERNRQSWKQYGPPSKLARTEPHNEAAYAKWKSERLSIIVPNNRKIAELLEHHECLFSIDEQVAIATFLMHTRSYEEWVEDKIPYAAVTRFPVGFDELIRGIADGGA